MNSPSKPYSVGQLNKYIRELFEYDPFLSGLYIEGEVSNFKAHESGHWYFTLKDERGAVKCVMFREAASRAGFMPKDGMRVVMGGSVSVYEKTGAYQFYAEEIKPLGAGDLQRAFEELKSRLFAEGIFDAKHKKPIPPNPKVIALVTSAAGAAVRDMINVVRRRSPAVKLVVAPCAVQGANAAVSIAAAIELVNAWGQADVILCGRGGGSIEDLWAFNEEVTARAIFASRIPVISAVGHETDVTIADFAADLRAPTPSAAAELAAPDAAGAVTAFSKTVKDFARAMAVYIANENLYARNRAESLTRGAARFMNERAIALDRAADGLNKVSPLKVFERGFGSIAKDGKRVKHIKDVAVGDNIEAAILGGRFTAAVTSVDENKGNGYA